MGSVLNSIQAKSCRSEDYYQAIEREFNLTHPWVWYIQGITSLVCLIMYIAIDGSELVFALYIPLDILLNASKVAFFWYEYYNCEKRR